MPKAKRSSHGAGTRRKQEQAEEGARPFWSGTISFGLVNIPVQLFPGARDSRISLRLLSPTGTPLSREYFESGTHKGMTASEMIRGVETSKGKVVTISDEELERLAPERSRNIDLRQFVPREEISPLWFENTYFLIPAEPSAKAYGLLAGVMEKTERLGIATFVMHGKEHLVAIQAQHGILRAHTLRFSDELRTPKDVGLPSRKKAPAASAVRRFETIIRKASRQQLNAAEMRDENAAAMLKLIARKRKERKNVVQTKGTRGRQPEKVIDLMEVLKRSLSKGTKAA